MTLTASGRVAIEELLERLKLSGGGEALLPSFICAAVIEAFNRQKVKIRYYSVNKNLEININELNSRINKSTKLLYLVHYFGFPDKLFELQAMAKAKNILLIEDCAHALFSKAAGKYLGTIGDGAVFSLRKFLPLPDGGGYILRSGTGLGGASRSAHSFTGNNWPHLKLLLKEVMFRLGLNPMIVNGGPKPARPDPANKFISFSSVKKIEQTDEARLVAGRRRNFQFYLMNIANLGGVSPIFNSLPAGVDPFAFPVLLNGRDQVVDRLKRKGIYLEATFSDSPSSDPGAKYLADHLLSLPVYQGLADRQLRCVLSELGKAVCLVGAA
ncbi:MAG: DegT/DnrJ/EryC1/StrS family aminotransferase [Candidatus Margulisiibacteriota bacterium]